MKKQTTLKFLLQFFLLILLLVVPTFSASLDDILNPPSTCSRIKILVLDFGLFVYDVVSDVVNGVNYIEDCNRIGGWVIIGIMFLPITIFLAWLGYFEFENGSRLKRVLILLLLLFGPVAIALATPAYIIYVAYVFARRVVQPSYVDNTFEKFLLDGNNRYAQAADLLKLFEAIFEANLQAIAVLYMILTAGLSKSFTKAFFQVGGIIASFASVSKFCAEWHIFTGYNINAGSEHPIPPEFSSTLKAMLFFAPHVIFRTGSSAFVLAYLKLYALIPLAVFLITSISISCLVDKELGWGKRIGRLLSLPLSIFTPTVTNPYLKSNRRLLKATMLSSTVILLLCLILIRLLPFLTEETLFCTLGLSHINLDTSNISQINLGSDISSPNLTCEIPSCDSDLNITECTGTPCQMATTMDDFSTYFFVPLLVLGIWCLYGESVILLGTEYKDWPLRKYLPYTLTEKPWIMMDRQQFAAHQEKEKQEKCEKLNRTAFEIRAKVVPMTEEELMEEKRAQLSKKVAKFGAKVVLLNEEEAEAAKREEDERQRQKQEDRQADWGINAQSLLWCCTPSKQKERDDEMEPVPERTEHENEESIEDNVAEEEGAQALEEEDEQRPLLTDDQEDQRRDELENGEVIEETEEENETTPQIENNVAGEEGAQALEGEDEQQPLLTDDQEDQRRDELEDGEVIEETEEENETTPQIDVKVEEEEIKATEGEDDKRQLLLSVDQDGQKKEEVEEVKVVEQTEEEKEETPQIDKKVAEEEIKATEGEDEERQLLLSVDQDGKKKEEVEEVKVVEQTEEEKKETLKIDETVAEDKVKENEVKEVEVVDEQTEEEKEKTCLRGRV